MTENIEAVKTICTWLAVGGKPCRRCLALHGTTFIVDITRKELIDSRFGPVYDLDTDSSLVHSHCMCQLEIIEIDVDMDKLELEE